VEEFSNAEFFLRSRLRERGVRISVLKSCKILRFLLTSYEKYVTLIPRGDEYMKKFNVKKIILIVIFVALMIASAVFWVADMIINNTAPTKNFFKAVVVILACAGSLARLLSKQGRKNLAFYENAYQEHIKDAFVDRPFYKKKLLCAIRLYNEDNYNKAIKYLVDLKNNSRTRGDIYAVGLMTGLTLTEMECYHDAIQVYNALIEMNITSSTVYGNLGNIHLTLGNHQDAISYIRLAIQNNENNPAPYNNLAQLYFETSDFENAKIYAEKALQINHKMYQASTLLAIIYTMEGDKANAEKFSHMAIASGRNPAELNAIIEHYTTAEPQNRDEE
jgi:tetratricopeptide (TPR) repeat protein